MNIKWGRRFVALFVVAISLFAFTACGENAQQTTSGIKNVIILIGDGMGTVHEEAGRIYKEKDLIWDSFPYSGKMDTDSLTTNDDDTPTDSAAAATAMATGQRVYNNYIGMDKNSDNINNIMEIALKKGKKTGVVTSDSLDGATPAGFSAHAPSRTHNISIIKSQIRSGIDILLGAGKKVYSSYSESIITNGYTHVDTSSNLTEELFGGRVFGTFESVEPNTDCQLIDLAEFAIDYLTQFDEGFYLMIEGAKIDKRSHSGDFFEMIDQLLDFDEVVEMVYNWAKDRDDTVIIVTADHETGGLELDVGANKENLKDSYRWTSGELTSFAHTAAKVNYYAWGHESEYFKDSIINTDIFKIAESFLS